MVVEIEGYFVVRVEELHWELFMEEGVEIVHVFDDNMGAEGGILVHGFDVGYECCSLEGREVGNELF